MKIIKQLIKILKKYEYTYKVKIIIDVSDQRNRPLFSLCPNDKYLQFHEEFTQIGVSLPGIDEIDPLIKKDGWETNHD
jgi:hypothetical protein